MALRQVREGVLSDKRSSDGMHIQDAALMPEPQWGCSRLGDIPQRVNDPVEPEHVEFLLCKAGYQDSHRPNRWEDTGMSC